MTHNGQSGIECILHVVSKVLDPSRDESCGIFIGEVVTTLFKHVKTKNIII